MLLKQFRDLHQYVFRIGEHISQIHTHLDKIDRTIDDMKNEHKVVIETNKSELEKIKEMIVSKSEVNRLLQELNNSFKGSLPELPETIPEEPEKEEAKVPETMPEEPKKEELEVPETEPEEPEKEEAYLEEKWEMEKPRKEAKKRRFPFLPRF